MANEKPAAAGTNIIARYEERNVDRSVSQGRKKKGGGSEDKRERSCVNNNDFTMINIQFQSQKISFLVHPLHLSLFHLRI